MKRNIESNREKLAKEAVDGMEMDALIIYANEQLIEYYKSIPQKEFNEEWELAFGE